jgi:hypothetical protein
VTLATTLLAYFYGGFSAPDNDPQPSPLVVPRHRRGDLTYRVARGLVVAKAQDLAEAVPIGGMTAFNCSRARRWSSPEDSGADP